VTLSAFSALCINLLTHSLTHSHIHGNVPSRECNVHCSLATVGKWTNPFTATGGDKTAMRPLTKLLWTLVYMIILFQQFHFILLTRIDGSMVDRWTAHGFYFCRHCLHLNEARYVCMTLSSIYFADARPN